MKKIFTFIAIFMIATCLTACSTPDDGVFKPDTNDNSQFEQTDKSDNKKSDTETKKDDSKADDKTSESKPDNKSDNNSSNKPANKPSNGNNSSASKPNSNNSSANKPSSGNTGNTSKPSNGNSGNNASKPAHQHTWVDHTATKQVPRTVHHDAVYETVTIPAVTKHQIQCLTCGQWFDSLDELTGHQLYDTNGACSGYDGHCERDVVITPAHTEQKLVKEAYDETVYDTQTYVDYKYCSSCGQHQ